MSTNYTPIQTQGVHHITLNGADRQTSIDFWRRILGMALVFEQPNLDAKDISHLYFCPGDGRLITIFTSEDRKVDDSPNPNDAGNLHHLVFNVSSAIFAQVKSELKDHSVKNSGEIDRGFMHSIIFRDPLRQLLELACYKFQTQRGFNESDVLHAAHSIRVAVGDYNTEDKHLAEAIGQLGK
ncbi:MAG: VOC family protein [Hyphomicrobiales bacterium]|nr:VOC family protein [Hyphomicrobiales bacterium]